MSRTKSKKKVKAVEPAIVAPLEPGTGWRSRLRPWILVALVILLTAIVRIRLLGIPLERDEGEYAYAGQLMLQGIPPYKLVFNMKFPGTYGAYALIMAIFGQSIVGIHLGFMVMNAGTIAMIYLLGKRLLNSTAGVAASAAYALLSVGEGVFGTQAHATHFVVAAAVGATLLLIRALDTERPSIFFWSGFLYGVAVLMKQHGILFGVFGGSYLLWSGWTLHRKDPATLKMWQILKTLAVFMAGVCAPIALTGFALWRSGVFYRFWFWTVTYAREYALESSLSDGITSFRTNFAHIVGPNLVIWVIAGSGLALIWWKKEDRAPAVLLTGFLAFSFLAVCPGLYFREHYFVLMLPAVALLAGAAVSCASRIWSGSSILLGGVYAAALLFAVVQQQKFLFEMSPMEASRAMYGANPFPEAVQIADYIRANSPPDSRIAVLGSEPEIPFYARRHSATGYIYMYGLMEPQPFALTMQNDLIHDVEASRPDYVVVVSVSSSWLRRKDSPSRIIDWWAAYGASHYRVVGVADITSPDHTEYRWDHVDSYRPQSSFNILICKRSG